MASRRRMEDSELWRAIGHTEAGQSNTDVAIFSVLYILQFRNYENNFLAAKQLSEDQRRVVYGLRPPRMVDILLFVAKQNQTSDFHTSGICDCNVYR